VSLAFDIFQGVGVASAVGVRPFLPGLVTGALAAGDVELTFKHTKHFHFLQQPVFLIVMVVLAIAFAVVQRRLAAREAAEPQALTGVVAVLALIIGGLLCAGAIGRSGHPWWIGAIAGVLCAGVGIAASRPLLTRVRARLGRDATTLDVLTELAAVVAAALSVVAPPVGVILLLALLYLLIAGRGRSDQKYAGLRILR
jgi:uncharacterized membrane protein